LFVPASNFIEISTNDSSEARKYFNEEHFENYLTKMAESSAKVRHYYTKLSQPLSSERISMVWDSFPYTF
jgi:hypothetical protein